MGARYYDAALGRFISADTLIANFGNPQSLNRYSYGLNNPVKYQDPSGHCVVGGHWMSDDTSACGGGGELVGFSGNWDPLRRSLVNQGVSSVASRLAGTVAADQAQAMAMIAQSGYHVAPSAISQLSGLWGQSSSDIFQAVYGDVTFRRIEGDPIDGWAETHLDWVGNGCNMGEICYDSTMFNTTNLDWLPQNVAHELGHGIDHRGERKARANLAAVWDAQNLERSDGGFAGDYPTWQQSDSDGNGEVFADMFLGWTYNTWGPGNPGARRSRYMEANMPSIVALAVSGD